MARAWAPFLCSAVLLRPHPNRSTREASATEAPQTRVLALQANSSVALPRSSSRMLLDLGSTAHLARPLLMGHHSWEPFLSRAPSHNNPTHRPSHNFLHNKAVWLREVLNRARCFPHNRVDHHLPQHRKWLRRALCLVLISPDSMSVTGLRCRWWCISASRLWTCLASTSRVFTGCLGLCHT